MLQFSQWLEGIGGSNFDYFWTQYGEFVLDLTHEEGYTAEQYRQMYERDYQHLIQHLPGKTIYRGINAQTVDPRLGGHWTTDRYIAAEFSKAMSNYDPRFGEVAKGRSHIIAKKITDISAIDLDGTISAQMTAGESEVVVAYPERLADLPSQP